MPPSPRPRPSEEPDVPASLTARVQARVAAAGAALERRAAASRPKARRPRQAPKPADPRAEADSTTQHETSLRMVFHDLAVAHRQHRTRSGQVASPALRTAVHQFRQAPSLPTLVGVAAHLDELGLLGW